MAANSKCSGFNVNRKVQELAMWERVVNFEGVTAMCSDSKPYRHTGPRAGIH